MVLKVLNTMSKKKEEFVPLNGKDVKMFVCGVTVFDYAHIGHGKAYVAYDVIARYLRYKGYKVHYIQNVTDLDDKIIQRAKEEMQDPLSLAKEYTKKYLKDMKALNVTSVDEYIPATKHIKEIIEQTETLIKKGYAYVAGDGVYYDLTKFEDYGKLSKRKAVMDMQKDDAVSRVDLSEFKKHPGDFCIWKLSKPDEPAWPSPWGNGRPGWHIEDTAISIKYFGSQYDLHGGGEDLIFPHHEAEIAIAEAYTGVKPFVNYWLHTAFLKVNGRKMSKSLHNFETLVDAIEKHGAPALRFFLATNPFYRPIDYTEKNLEEAKGELERIQTALDGIGSLVDSAVEKQTPAEQVFKVDEYRQKFIAAMDDSFNTADAKAVLFDFVRDINKLMADNSLHSKKTINDVLVLFKEFEQVLGVVFEPKKAAQLSKALMDLIAKRDEARKNKDWAESDRLRDELAKKGVLVMDTPDGTKWKIQKV